LTHTEKSSILPEIAPDFDNVELYANVIGGSPKLIARGGGGKLLTILDQELYNKFLANGTFSASDEEIAAWEAQGIAMR